MFFLKDSPEFLESHFFNISEYIKEYFGVLFDDDCNLGLLSLNFEFCNIISEEALFVLGNGGDYFKKRFGKSSLKITTTNLDEIIKIISKELIGYLFLEYQNKTISYEIPNHFITCNHWILDNSKIFFFGDSMNLDKLGLPILNFLEWLSGDRDFVNRV